MDAAAPLEAPAAGWAWFFVILNAVQAKTCEWAAEQKRFRPLLDYSDSRVCFKDSQVSGTPNIKDFTPGYVPLIS
jgi:hypothetical protein